MPQLRSLIVMAVLITSLLFVQHGKSEDAKKEADKSADKAADKAPAKGAKPAAVADKAKPRLPNFLGQVGLDDDQKTKIYDVQAKYRPEVEKLNQQLADLKAKEQADIDAVLTDEQRAKYTELQEAAKKKRGPKAGKAAEAAPEEK